MDYLQQSTTKPNLHKRASSAALREDAQPRKRPDKELSPNSMLSTMQHAQGNRDPSYCSNASSAALREDAQSMEAPGKELSPDSMLSIIPRAKDKKGPLYVTSAIKQRQKYMDQYCCKCKVVCEGYEKGTRLFCGSCDEPRCKDCQLTV